MAAEREERARKARDVWACDSDDGLKTLIAKAASGDVVWFLATVNRIADLLAAEGDTDPVGVRRSKAIGILAQPVQALALLAAHRHDPPSPDDQAEPARDEDRDDDREEDRDHAANDGSGLSEPGAADGDESGPSTSSGRNSLVLDRPAGGLEVKRLRPRVVLHFHLSDTAIRTRSGLVRPEYGTANTLAQLRDWLADTGCPVTVQPVLDPAMWPRWMRTRSRTAPGTRSGTGTWPMCSPTVPAPPPPWTWTTPSRTCRWTGADHPAKPAPPIWGR